MIIVGERYPTGCHVQVERDKRVMKGEHIYGAWKHEVGRARLTWLCC